MRDGSTRIFGTTDVAGPVKSDAAICVADQAVIAIENVRLFDEVQARTRDLSETLEHQTATSEVLNVITRSPTDAQPVFDAIVQSAARLCEAMFSLVFLYDGDLLRPAATHNFTPEVLNRLFQTYPKRPDRSLLAGRAVLDGRIVHVADLLADQEHSHQLALAGNWQAGLAVPMLRDGKPVGAISVARAEAVPFSERQIQLLTTFADQAVIAIENVRLFTELQASIPYASAGTEPGDKCGVGRLAMTGRGDRQSCHGKMVQDRSERLPILLDAIASKSRPAELDSGGRGAYAIRALPEGKPRLPKKTGPELDRVRPLRSPVSPSAPTRNVAFGSAPCLICACDSSGASRTLDS